MKALAVTLAIIWMFAGPLKAFAVGERHDEYSLDLQGYSAETIDAMTNVINRQEGRYPKAYPGRDEQLIYNIFNANWIESYKPFSQNTVDPPKWPERP